MTVHRQPTADWCKLLFRILWNATGKTPCHFDSLKRLDDLGFREALSRGPGALDGDEKAKLWEALSREPAPNAVGVAHDQCQKQLTGICWLQALGLVIEGCPDPLHRLYNDTDEAVCKAGLKDKEQAAVLLCNVLFGPWNSSAFFHEVHQEGLNAMQRMGPDDPWLIKFWPLILKDHGLHLTPGALSRARRVFFCGGGAADLRRH